MNMAEHMLRFRNMTYWPKQQTGIFMKRSGQQISHGREHWLTLDGNHTADAVQSKLSCRSLQFRCRVCTDRSMTPCFRFPAGR
ncbi:hypothetical protein D3C84_996540 [compost metagenome]